MTLKEITDIENLISWRQEVIENVFDVTPDSILLAANVDYYLRHISDGTHVAFVAMDGDAEIGCGAVCFTEELPSPDNPTGRCAYLMNIYVRSPYRGKGIASHIVEKLVEIARDRDCDKIYLETTDKGRPVYTALGFRDMPDMMKLENA